jgi:hypothetical protein
MIARASALAALLLLVLEGTGQAMKLPWEATAELSGVHTVNSAAIFDYAICGDGSVLARLHKRWAGGVFVEYRRVLDPVPATSFWYADLGLRGRLNVTTHLWIRLDLGWSIRHIALSDGYANTVSGIVVGTGLGVILWARPNWDVSLATVYHYTARTQAEYFSTQDIRSVQKSGWARLTGQLSERA